MTPTHLRIVSFLEGLSFIALLCVAYLFDLRHLVRYAGMTHGVLFIAFIIILLVVCQRQKWSVMVFIFGLIAAILPLMPFVFERYVHRLEMADDQHE